MFSHCTTASYFCLTLTVYTLHNILKTYLDKPTFTGIMSHHFNHHRGLEHYRSRYHHEPPSMPSRVPLWHSTCRCFLKCERPPDRPNVSLVEGNPLGPKGPDPGCHEHNEVNCQKILPNPNSRTQGYVPDHGSYFQESLIAFESQRRCSWVPLNSMTGSDFDNWIGNYPLSFPPAPAPGYDFEHIRQDDILYFLANEFREPMMRGLWEIRRQQRPRYPGPDGEGWSSVLRYRSFELSVRQKLSHDIQFEFSYVVSPSSSTAFIPL